jgi:hypothetical protein
MLHTFMPSLLYSIEICRVINDAILMDLETSQNVSVASEVRGENH